MIYPDNNMKPYYDLSEGISIVEKVRDDMVTYHCKYDFCEY